MLTLIGGFSNSSHQKLDSSILIISKVINLHFKLQLFALF